ncbi:hypothetical protein [Maricaulis sp.]|uniref:tetratricopeptide repeat protein n=1 Tax=Maricaulis sp. TaxID=1486257 RepID=UPI00262A72E4|nr:hypothetical protein [Maricaulis sp.]
MRGQMIRTGLAGFASALALMSFTPMAAADIQPEAERSARGAVISARIGDRLVRYMEAEAEQRWSEALSGYDALMRDERLSDFERATVLELRGRARYQLERPRAAAADWQAAIEIGILARERANLLRINAGQILLAEGEYQAGIFLIETALALGAALTGDIAFRLAQGYGQLGDYASGLDYARRAFALAAPAQRRHYSLLLFYYQSLDMMPEQLELIEQMVAQWPQEKQYWSSWATLLARMDRSREAFDVNAVMYTNGLLSEPAELIRLAEYYAYFDYPYRGAMILQREINAGRIEANPRHYRMLARLFRQAREWEAALPVLRRVATLTGRGQDYAVLGEALYQSGQFRDAEAMFVQALRRGELDRPGDIHAFLGNARVELDDYENAAKAFTEALDWEYSRAAAQGWLDFIARRREILDNAERQAHRVEIQRCGNWVEDERRSIPTHDDRFDTLGRRLFNLPDGCTTYFNSYGELWPRWEEV